MWKVIHSLGSVSGPVIQYMRYVIQGNPGTMSVLSQECVFLHDWGRQMVLKPFVQSYIRNHILPQSYSVLLWPSACRIPARQDFLEVLLALGPSTWKQPLEAAEDGKSVYRCD